MDNAIRQPLVERSLGGFVQAFTHIMVTLNIESMSPAQFKYLFDRFNCNRCTLPVATEKLHGYITPSLSAAAPEFTPATEVTAATQSPIAATSPPPSLVVHVNTNAPASPPSPTDDRKSKPGVTAVRVAQLDANPNQSEFKTTPAHLPTTRNSASMPESPPQAVPTATESGLLLIAGSPPAANPAAPVVPVLPNESDSENPSSPKKETASDLAEQQAAQTARTAVLAALAQLTGSGGGM